MKRALVVCAVLLAQAAPALAQSKKYPPVPPDKDLEEEQRSGLWEGALQPERKPYQELVREARKLLDSNRQDDIQLGIDKLGDAITRMPKMPDAYVMRGNYYLTQRTWSKCADDLGAAEDFSPIPAPDLAARTRSRLDLALCQARAGRLADAERTLVRALTTAPNLKGELWMRLGETRIALGKLDEAIDALYASLESGDSIHNLTRWLLALAYDRARRPSEAQEHATNARRYENAHLLTIAQPTFPFLGAGDSEYLHGVAYRYATSPVRPEYALLYFRRFLALAPDSPWKRRADEHVRDLTATRFPYLDVNDKRGSAPLVVNEARDAIAKAMPALRACVAKFPASVFKLEITKVGPRTPETARDRPLYRVPPAGLRASLDKSLDGRTSDPAITQAQLCLEKVAKPIKLATPKERDTFYTLTFLVVAP